MAKTPRSDAKKNHRKAFRQGIFPEDLITPNMIKRFTFVIECPPNQPSYKEFKATEGMLLTRVPSFMAPPIEFCDHLLKINDKPVTNRKELMEILYEASQNSSTHFLVFQIRRIMCVEQMGEEEKLPMNASVLKPAVNNPLIKPTIGYMYYRIVLIHFPRSKLGINIKSYNDVVYVESTDNTWGSTTRRFLYVGDAILKIDDEEVIDLKSTERLLKSGFQNNGLVTMVIERATGQLAANYVRSVLSFNKCNDPQLASDVILICKKRHDYLVKNGFGPEPKPIIREKLSELSSLKEKSPARHVSVSKKVDYLMIGCEQYNPATMIKVPNYMDPTVNTKPPVEPDQPK